jgi:hypothetical protein
MSEEEFLALVACLAGDFKNAYGTGAAWEIAAQVAIAIALKSKFGIEKAREIAYADSKESCDFGFTYKGKKYAIELKVEAPDGKFGGSPLGSSMVGDVNKLHGFAEADEKWFLIVAISERARKILMAQLDRGDSWIGRETDGVAIALCNIATQPRGLPWTHYSPDVLSADKKNVRGHGF